MSNAKSPDNPPGPGYQGFAAHGLAAYKQTITQKASSKDTPPVEPSNQEGIPQSKGGLQFIKTNSPPKAKGIRFRKTLDIASETEAQEEEQESKYRRVAKLLILIGSDEAAKILSHLDPEQVEAISKE
ncbi:MAG: hypothetical protein LBG76_07375, partial [Treponema sp.]|nr:hypothetical protein [Treponema sp.]